MKVFRAFLLAAITFTGVFSARLNAAPSGSTGVSGRETTTDASNLRLPDLHKELRQLSKNLKLKKSQRVGVNSILEERDREIRLLIDVEPLLQDYRDQLAAKVMQDSDAQIETLLKSNQKIKFDKVLAKEREAR
jgi:hypothetical protein